jgi:hypothetical protein
MKKTFLLYTGIIITAIFAACSGSKELRTMQHDINGNWVLQTIVTEGASGKIKDKIFNEADFGCFIGSEWNFAKNNTGSYTLVDKQKTCPEIKRNISWSFTEAKNIPVSFHFKRLDDKNNPMDTGDGFSLAITQLDKTAMKLKEDIMLDGHPASIIYNFVKQ